jgi:hypothetical protein
LLDVSDLLFHAHDVVGHLLFGGGIQTFESGLKVLLEVVDFFYFSKVIFVLGISDKFFKLPNM